MADLVRDWFKRKLAGGVSPLRGIVTAEHEYNRVTGPRSIYAKVSLSISPNDVFAFESKARWPEENYDRFVLDGILAAAPDPAGELVPRCLALVRGGSSRRGRDGVPDCSAEGANGG